MFWGTVNKCEEAFLLKPHGLPSPLTAVAPTTSSRPRMRLRVSRHRSGDMAWNVGGHG